MRRLGEWVLVLASYFLLFTFAAFLLFAAKNAMSSEDLDPCVQELSLPEKCREFYNDGTDSWINCMGVGYK